MGGSINQSNLASQLAQGKFRGDRIQRSETNIKFEEQRLMFRIGCTVVKAETCFWWCLSCRFSQESPPLFDCSQLRTSGGLLEPFHGFSYQNNEGLLGRWWDIFYGKMVFCKTVPLDLPEHPFPLWICEQYVISSDPSVFQYKRRPVQ